MAGEAQATPGRRERKTAATRDRIYRAALELFSERGLSSVTVEQITQRADVGKGTFFNYFANKEAILTDFGADQLARIEQAVERGEIQGPPPARLQQLLQVLASHPLLTPALARDLFTSALNNQRVTEVEGPTIWHIQGLLAGIIREGQESGDFRRDWCADEAALFALGQYFLAQLSWCTGFSDVSLAQTVDDFVMKALAGLAAR